MAYIYDLADTWNAVGTTFTGIKLNVTDSASAAGSLLMDLQVGGTSRFSVDKSGTVLIPSRFASTTTGLTLGVATNSNDILGIQPGALGVRSGDIIGWSGSATIPTGAIDLILRRDAADTLAQRRGTTPQAFHLYNSYSSSTIYERGFMKWENNEFQIGTAAAGTGTGRAVSLRTPSGRYLTLSDGTTLDSNAVYYRFFAAGVTIANLNINTKQFVMGLGGSFTFSSGADSFGTAVDVGIERNAAGVAKITNGSTGAGQLIFIVPTTNPGITGALWNNAGTLSISA